MNAIIQVSLVLVTLSLPVYHLLREKIRRRLAANRLIITDAVSQMEQMLLQGDSKLGDACHDVLFKIMFEKQFVASHSTHGYFAVDPKLSREQLQKCESLAEKIYNELCEDSAMQQILHKYVEAYFRVAVYSNPLGFLAMAFRLFCKGRLKIVLGRSKKKPVGSHEVVASRGRITSVALRRLGNTRPILFATSCAMAAPMMRAENGHAGNYVHSHN
jgi:hypothetical protein